MQVAVTYRTYATPETLFRSAQGVLDLIAKGDDIDAYVAALDVSEDDARGKRLIGELPADDITINRLVDGLYRKAGQLHDWHGYSALERTQDDPVRACLELEKWCLRELDADTRRELIGGHQQASGLAKDANGHDESQGTTGSKKWPRAALIAAIASHMLANPKANSPEIAKALGVSESRVRQVWVPIKEAARRADREKLRGLMRVDDDGDAMPEGIDESTSCEYCRVPINPEWECPICGEGGNGLCHECHNSSVGHPESRYVPEEGNAF